MTELCVRVFLWVLNRSIAAGWAVLFVLALRFFLRRVPRRFICPLWAAVAFRLCVPVSLPGGFSLIPSAQTVPQDIGLQASPAIHSGVTVIDRTVNAVLPAATPAASANPMQFYLLLAALVWAAGAAALLAYSLVSALRLRRLLQAASPLPAGQLPAEFAALPVSVLPGLATPFVFGLLFARVYLPPELSSRERRCILAHEAAHLRRGDPLTKLFGWLLLCINWANPLLWVAYRCFETDLEQRCDESVLQHMSSADGAVPLAELKKEYSGILLSLAARPHFAGCPLAFGENGIRQRIRGILNYRKPAFWLSVVLVAAVAALGVGLLFDPAEQKDKEASPAAAAAASSSVVSAVPDASPAVQARPALTKQTADEAISQLLQTLTLHRDDTVTFTVPQALPADDAGKAQLFLSLTANYQTQPGVYRADRLLDLAPGWTGGEVYTGHLDGEGTLQSITLYASYMTALGDNQYQSFSANHATLNAPFTYDAPAYGEPALKVSGSGQTYALAYTTGDKKQVAISLTLPDGFSLAAAEEYPDYDFALSEDTDLPRLVLLQGGAPVGLLSVLSYGAVDAATLADVRTDSPSFPMQIYAPIALSSRFDFGSSYTVVSSTATASNAVTRVRFQDLAAAASDQYATGIPWREYGCVLAYDLASQPYFLMLGVEPEVLSASALRAAAQSVTFSAA